MEAVIEIPSPTPRDSETVVTALETAAIFRAKGDAAEALRWLQRAAESASADGDDERTLVIARTASELSHALHRPARAELPVNAEASLAPPSRRLPKPPPRTGATRPSEDDAEPPASVARVSPPSSQAAAAGPPPAPSSRPLPLSPNGRPAYSHTPGSTRAPSAPSANRSASPPKNYQQRYSNPALPASAGSVPTPAPRAHLQAHELPAFSSEDADAQRLTQPALAAGVRDRELHRAAGLRHAARVSVIHSPDEPGLFLVRLLDDGARPPVEASEALMVLVDPSSTLFSE